MTKSQTYLTRVLTARDHRLVDALERVPRFRKVAHFLRPPAPPSKAAKVEDPVAKPTPKADHQVAKPTPKGKDD